MTKCRKKQANINLLWLIFWHERPTVKGKKKLIYTRTQKNKPIVMVLKHDAQKRERERVCVCVCVSEQADVCAWCSYIFHPIQTKATQNKQKAQTQNTHSYLFPLVIFTSTLGHDLSTQQSPFIKITTLNNDSTTETFTMWRWRQSDNSRPKNKNLICSSSWRWHMIREWCEQPAHTPHKRLTVRVWQCTILKDLW